MFDRSCELIYERISKRLRCKKEEINTARNKDGDKPITDKDIYPDDPNLVSAIMRNRRNPKKNKYLIPGETSRRKKRKKCVETIVRTLQFDSARTLLWGNEWEIKAYDKPLFFRLIFDMIECPEMKQEADRLYNILHEYIPFAVADFCGDFLSEYPCMEAVFERKYLITDEERFVRLLEAIEYFYLRVENEFLNALKEKLYGLKDTLKLDIRFLEFVREKVMPMLENAVPSYSTGQDIYQTLYSRYEALQVPLKPYLETPAEEMYLIEEPKAPYSGKMIRRLVAEDFRHVNTLSRIQREETKGLKNLEFHKLLDDIPGLKILNAPMEQRIQYSLEELMKAQQEYVTFKEGLESIMIERALKLECLQVVWNPSKRDT